MMQRIYRCDGTIDGIFTAIYDAWASKYGHRNIKIAERDEASTLELFSEYIEVVSNEEKAGKVAGSIRSKISEEVYSLVCNSCLSKMPGRSDSVYRFLLLAFSQGEKIMEQLANPYVHPIFSMNRNVINELTHYQGFLRFHELKNGVLSARIRPENNLLMLLAAHFTDRFMEENWIIYDMGRDVAAIHEAKGTFFIVDGAFLEKERFLDYSEKEKKMQKTWKAFVDSVGIKARANARLQRQMLPYRFREFMDEFRDTVV